MSTHLQEYLVEITDSDSPYTASVTRNIFCDATSGAITVNLPTISGNTGRQYTIKKIDSSANAVTVDGSGAETIDGSTTAVINSQYESITIQATSSEWGII